MTIRGRVLREDNRQPAPSVAVRIAVQSSSKTTTEVIRTAQDGTFELTDGTIATTGEPMVRITVLAPTGVPVCDVHVAPTQLESALDLVIPRHLDHLFHPPERIDTPISGSLRGAPPSLAIRKRGPYSEPVLQGMYNHGPVGAPALPTQNQHVLLAPGIEIKKVNVTPGRKISLTGIDQPLPVQPPIPDRPGPVSQRGRRIGTDAPLAPVLMTHALDPNLLSKGSIIPEQLVVLGKPEQHPKWTIVPIQLWPVQYDVQRKAFDYFPEMKFELQYGPLDGSPLTQDSLRVVVDRETASTLHQLISGSATLTPPGLSIEWSRAGFHHKTPMVIITDDCTWSSTQPSQLSTRQIDAPTPGAPLSLDSAGFTVTQHFQRLADWKIQRGVNTRVFTIREIINANQSGKYDAYGPASTIYDLAEMVRRFIRYAKDSWGTQFVLLGGDVSIIPMRYVVNCTLDFYRAPGAATAANLGAGTLMVIPDAAPSATPKKSFAKLKIANASVIDWSRNFALTQESLLCTSRGVRIGFLPPGDSIGWFFTTQADFENKTSDFTVLNQSTDTSNNGVSYVIAHGPTEVLNDDYYFLHPSREIPTDHYYASCSGSDNSHGCDTNGNGICGQYQCLLDGSEPSIDGVDVIGDVSVGRAPIASADQAANFVNKVLLYEKLHGVDASYLSHLTFICDDWVWPWCFSQLPSDPKDRSNPPEGYFGIIPFKPVETPAVPGQQPTVPESFGSPYIPGKRMDPESLPGKQMDPESLLIHIQQDGVGLADTLTASLVDGSQRFRLILGVGQTEWIVPYAHDPDNQTKTGWYYCDSKWNPVPLKEPKAGRPARGTQFIRVDSEHPIACDNVFWDCVTMDYAVPQKERVRQDLKQSFPAFENHYLLYRDYVNANIQDSANALPLTADGAKAALNAGPHLLSLTGHGNADGCCLLQDVVRHNLQLTNAGQPFVAFAQSCLTSQPDSDFYSLTSFGSKLVTQENGAVAYVGYTRECNTGDENGTYEECFWQFAAKTGNLGCALAQHATKIGTPRFTWNFPLTLYGDPEMPIWTDIPKPFTVVWPKSFTPGSAISVTVLNDQKQPLLGQSVTAIGLAHENSKIANASFILHDYTDGNGQVHFLLPDHPAAALVRLTISSPPGSRLQRFIPAIKDFPLGVATIPDSPGSLKSKVAAQ